MSKPLQGVRVLEVAIWGFGPIGPSVMADWGADVIKVEQPRGGDPLRLFSENYPGDEVDATWDHVNRGKRGIAVDVATDEGRDVIYRLAQDADVFYTSLLPDSRRRLKIDVEHIRAVNPSIIYARASAYGPKGPQAEVGGFEGNAFWCRTGASAAAMSADDTFPSPNVVPGGLFGDYSGGHILMGGVAAALFHRERTGEPSIVDGSLYGCGVWAMGWGIIGDRSEWLGRKVSRAEAHLATKNALMNTYRTSDGRFLAFEFHEVGRGGSPLWWPDLCAHLERPELVEDPRFVGPQEREANAQELVEALDGIFALRTLADWRERLEDLVGPWAPILYPPEVRDDPQAIANRYVTEITRSDGVTLPVIASPVQFDEENPELVRAPDHGEHTRQVLAEAGYSTDEIARLDEAGAIRIGAAEAKANMS